MQEELVYNLIRKTAEKLGLRQEIPSSAVVCYDEYVGAGYSLPTESMVEAVSLLAKTEGILLDPVYTGKAMAGLYGQQEKQPNFGDQIRHNCFNPHGHFLFKN